MYKSGSATQNKKSHNPKFSVRSRYLFHYQYENFATSLPTIFLGLNLGMPPEKKPPARKTSGKDDPEKNPPKKKYVPGWDYVSDDEKAKEAKKGRRRKKGGDKEEPSEAGPSVHISPSPSIIIEAYQVRSSTVASSPSAQTSSKPGPSVPKSSSVYSLPTLFDKLDADNGRTSTATMQIPAPAGTRQTLHAPDQCATAISYPIRPVQSSTHATTPQAGQSSSDPSQGTM